MNSNPPTTSILGVPISRLGMEDALQACRKRVATRAGGYVCFANVHTVTESRDDPSLRDALTGAFLALADGVPLVWVSRLRGEPIASRVCGPDFMPEFLRRFPDLRHAFVGGAPGVGEELVKSFCPNATAYSPPHRDFSEANAREDWDAVVRSSASNEALPEVVWVGLGAPKQEYWMAAVSALAPEVFFFGVGAAFDFLAESKNRAPIWMQKIGLEWFFRMMQEPNRLWKRYLSTNSRFLFALFRLFFSRR